MQRPLTTYEAANFIGRSPGAVRNLVARRQIPFRKVGGRLMFFQKELFEWVNTAPGVTVDEIKKRRGKNE